MSASAPWPCAKGRCCCFSSAGHRLSRSSFPPTTAAARCTWLFPSRKTSTPPGRPACSRWELPSRPQKNGRRVGVAYISATRIITCWSWPLPECGPTTEQHPPRAELDLPGEGPADENVATDAEDDEGEPAAPGAVDAELVGAGEQPSEREIRHAARLRRDKHHGNDDCEDGFPRDEARGQQRPTLLVEFGARRREFSARGHAGGDPLEHAADDAGRRGLGRQIHSHGDEHRRGSINHDQRKGEDEDHGPPPPRPFYPHALLR